MVLNEMEGNKEDISISTLWSAEYMWRGSGFQWLHNSVGLDTLT